MPVIFICLLIFIVALGVDGAISQILITLSVAIAIRIAWGMFEQYRLNKEIEEMNRQESIRQRQAEIRDRQQRAEESRRPNDNFYYNRHNPCGRSLDIPDRLKNNSER